MASKAHWGYGQVFLDTCRAELTLSGCWIERNDVWLLEREHPVAFYSLVQDGNSASLEHFFVTPAEIGRGHGTRMWDDAVRRARRRGCRALTIDSDPNAESFYLVKGADRSGTVPSASIPGRELPRLQFSLGNRQGESVNRADPD